MCDCYEHSCEICGEGIPMHIGDFKFPRTAFKAWCRNHLEFAESGSVLFTVTKMPEYEVLRKYEETVGIFEGWQCAILGPEVGEINGGDNHPNLGCDLKEDNWDYLLHLVKHALQNE